MSGKRAAGKAVIGVAVLAMGAAIAPSAWASVFTIDVAQDGGNVVATGGGSIDLTGLTFFDGGGALQIYSFVDASAGELVVGPSLSFYDAYSGIVGPSSFGTGGFTFSSSGTGDIAGPDTNGMIQLLIVPTGYASGDPLSDSATWDGTTLSDLGLTPGTYTWTWDGGADSLVVNIGNVAVPEPMSITLIGSAVALLALRRRRRAA
jgi:hypothetical protein